LSKKSPPWIENILKNLAILLSMGQEMFVRSSSHSYIRKLEKNSGIEISKIVLNLGFRQKDIFFRLIR